MDYLLSEAERSYEYFPETSGKKKKKENCLVLWEKKKKNHWKWETFSAISLGFTSFNVRYT